MTGMGDMIRCTRAGWGQAMVVGVVLGLLGALSAGAEPLLSDPDEGGMMSRSSGEALDEAEATDEELEPPRVFMHFEDANIKDILNVFARETGINLVVSEAVPDQALSLYLENVTAIDAFDQILEVSGLMYERPPGSEIYIIKPIDPDAVEPMTRVYQLNYARVSASVLASAAHAFGQQTPFEASLDVGSSTGGGASRGLGGGTEEVVAGVDGVLEHLLTPKGSVVVDARTNRLIVTDVPENFARLEAALAALDVRTAQILVEAQIIETTLQKLKDLGVEWGTGSEGSLFQLTPAKRETRFPFAQWFGDQGRAQLLSGSTTITDPRMTVGTVDPSLIAAVLQALETDTETHILARPKILTLDNESAVIRLTTDQAIGFETVAQATTGTESSKPERTTTGVVLVVTPQVNRDGYVTMLVEPSVTKTVASQISAPSGQATPIDPKTRSTRALVRVRSGQTLVMGGLVDRSESETLRKVPLLGDLPVIGKAFQNQEISDIESELIAFVTPTILEETPGQAGAVVQGPTVTVRRRETIAATDAPDARRIRRRPSARRSE